jgi:hypothetical protein
VFLDSLADELFTDMFAASKWDVVKMKAFAFAPAEDIDLDEMDIKVQQAKCMDILMGCVQAVPD